MSVDLHHRVSRAAPEPTHQLDVAAVQARARQLHRRRTASVAATVIVLVALGVVGVVQLVDRQPLPVIGPTPTSGAWQHVGVGEALTLPDDPWASHNLGSPETVRTASWTPAAERLLSAAEVDLANDVDRMVGQDGALLLVLNDHGDDPRVLTVDADGTQQLASVPGQPDHIQAVWSPAGHWLLLATSRDGASAHRLTSAGQVVQSVSVSGYQPPSGDGWLVIHEGEVWIGWSGSEVPNEGSGFQAARLTDDGGDRMVQTLHWQPADQVDVTAPIEAIGLGLVPSRPNALPRLTTTDSGAERILLDAGAATIDVGVPEGTQHMVSLIARQDGAWGLADGHMGGATQPVRYATVLLAHDDGVWVTGFPEVVRAAAVHIDPDGRPWFLQLTTDRYELTNLSPPTSPSD